MQHTILWINKKTRAQANMKIISGKGKTKQSIYYNCTP